MSHCLCIGGLVIVADAAAWVLSAQSGDSRWIVYITSGTTIMVALCGAAVLTAPHIGKAATAIITAIMPALAELQKYREEINKGTLSARLEEMQKSLEDKADELVDLQRKAALDLKEANAKAAEDLAESHRKAAEERAEVDRKHSEDLAALRKNLHTVRDTMSSDIINRQADIVERDKQIAELKGALQQMTEQSGQQTAQIRALRETEARLQAELVKSQIRQDVRIAGNTAAIQEMQAKSDPEMPTSGGGATTGI